MRLKERVKTEAESVVALLFRPLSLPPSEQQAKIRAFKVTPKRGRELEEMHFFLLYTVEFPKFKW